MIAVPRWRFPEIREHDPSAAGAETLAVIPSILGEGLFIKCEIVHPSSSEGRSVTLCVPPDRADAMLRALRDYARDRRKATT